MPGDPELVSASTNPANAANAANAPPPMPARLMLTLPVRDHSGEIQSARMYLHLGFVGAAKTPQAIPDLPVAAPRDDGTGVTTRTRTRSWPMPTSQSVVGRG